MQKSRKFLLLGCLAAFLFSCQDTGKNPQAEDDVFNNGNNNLDLNDHSADNIKPNLDVDVAPLLAREANIVASFPKSSNQLAFDLYQKIATEENPTFSPLSISAALAMAYTGSKDETEKEFKKVLYFGENAPEFHKSFGDFTLLLAKKDRSGTDTSFEIANALWLQKDFTVLEAFKNTLTDAYKAQPVPLDFKTEAGKATAYINKTISTQTHGEIDKLLKTDLPVDTRLVLTNALYFKSKWQKTFESGSTSDGSFTLKNGSPKDVKFMRQLDTFSYGEDEQKQILLMPYKDPEFAALFVLPREGQLAQVESGLWASNFETMLGGLSSTKVNLWLPKFSQRTLPKVKEALADLGLKYAFDRTQANFKGINENSAGENNLYIGNIAHEAVVKMYEEGTTAAAATAITFAVEAAMPGPSEPEKIIDFRADRPFLFYIIHQPSGTILFMGRVDDPQGEEN